MQGHDDVAALIWSFLSKKSICLCVLLNSLWLERAENYGVSVQLTNHCFI